MFLIYDVQRAPTTYSGRITALAIDPTCNATTCRLWVAAAGGGIWRRTTRSREARPGLCFRQFGTNAIGTLTYDVAHSTLYAGTGEPNASGDSEAGLGVYKSTDSGTTWAQLAATTSTSSVTTVVIRATLSPPFDQLDRSGPEQRQCSLRFIDPRRPWRGSVTGGATTNPPTPRPPFGLFKSIDGGATFTFIWTAMPPSGV